MGVGLTTTAKYAFGVERNPLLSGCARNGKNLRIPQGNAELVNECPHGTDIQKQNKGSALVKNIVGIEVL